MIEIRHIDRQKIESLVSGLEGFEREKALKKGLSAAGNVIRSGGKARLRQRMKSGTKGVTGNLLKSSIVRVKRNKPGVLIGFKRGTGGGNHVHLVDKGTNPRLWKTRSRKSTGSAPANYFWTDTELQDTQKAVNSIYTGIDKAMTKIISK